MSKNWSDLLEAKASPSRRIDKDQGECPPDKLQNVGNRLLELTVERLDVNIGNALDRGLERAIGLRIFLDKQAPNLRSLADLIQAIANLSQLLDRDHERRVVERFVLGFPRSRESVDVHELARERANVVGDSFKVAFKKEML